MLGLGLGLTNTFTLGTGGASAYAPYRAPAGYRWEFVTEDGVRLQEDGEPVVDLVEID